MTGTVLQHHLAVKTVPQPIIIDRLKVSRTTLNKWKLGVLYPHRINASQLIGLFSEYDVRLDFNDIYLVDVMEDAV